MKNNISLLVALKNNLDYTKHFYTTTRQLYPEVEICFSSYNSTDGTNEWLESLANDPYTKVFYTDEYGCFSDNYNKAAELATKDYILYVHNDIVLAPNFLEIMESYVSNDTIVSYSTIEPPIFSGHERPGKIVKDFGDNLDNFNLKGLYEFVSEKQIKYKNQTLEDISFFMCIPRKTYLEIGGLDNLYDPMFCEDIDLCVRFKLLGLKFIMALDAITYHFVSKTSRFSEEYKNKTAKIERNSNLNFIRKWGTFVKPIEALLPSKYNIAFVVKNCNLELLGALEPWCDRIYVNEQFEVIGRMWDYIELEQENTKLDLSKRVLTIENNSPLLENNIVVEFDAKQFTQQSFNIIQQLSEIIKENGEIGEFELDIFKIHIYNLETENLIKNKN
jgi:GT2 family glycosyltransferase